MKEQFHIVLITVSLFVAGLLIGVWTQKTRPIPPPPAPVLGEFGNLSSPEIREGKYAPAMGGFAIERFSPGPPAAIVTMNRSIAELEPKIREFQGAVDSIEKEFREKLDKLAAPASAVSGASSASIEASLFRCSGVKAGAPRLLCLFRQEMGTRHFWPAFAPHFRSAAG